MLTFYETITIVMAAISMIFLIVFVFLDKLQYRKKKYLYNTILTIIFSFVVELLISWKMLNIAVVIYPLYIASFFLIYPFMYLYYVEILETVTPIKHHGWKHLIMFLITLVISILTFIMLDTSGRIGLIESRLVLNLDEMETKQIYFTVIYILYYTQLLFYIFKLQQLSKFSKSIDSLLNGTFKTWINIFIVSIIVYELLLIIVTFLVNQEINYAVNQFFGFMVLTFIGILAINQSTFLLQLKINSFEKKQNQNHYNFTENDKNDIATILEDYLTVKKIYLDPNLKLNDLARKIHIPEKKLSYVINQVYSTNFNKFINTFRIEEAKKILLQQKQSNFENLFLLTGFNSRATFNRAFKENTELTPREFYLKNNSKI